MITQDFRDFPAGEATRAAIAAHNMLVMARRARKPANKAFWVRKARGEWRIALGLLRQDRGKL
jgi:hypothetical protein